MKADRVLSLSLEIQCVRRAVEAAGRVLEDARDRELDADTLGRAVEAGTAVLGLIEGRLRLVEKILTGEVDAALAIERFNSVAVSVAADAMPDVLLKPMKSRENNIEGRTRP